MPYDLRALVPGHRAIVSAIRQMFPDESDDDLADTVAGESNLPDAILAVLRAALEREAHAKALGEMIDGMTARKRRLEEGAKSMRLAALQAMQDAGLKKLAAPDMSLSVSPGKSRLVILDDAAVPETLCRVKREPDRKAIAEWLAEVDGVPNWAAWEAPKAFLTVHRK